MIINQYRLDKEGFASQKELPARLRCGHGCCGAEPADGTDDLAFCLIYRIEHCSPSPQFPTSKPADAPVSACRDERRTVRVGGATEP
jgi:hypothetical protein